MLFILLLNYYFSVQTQKYQVFFSHRGKAIIKKHQAGGGNTTNLFQDRGQQRGTITKERSRTIQKLLNMLLMRVRSYFHGKHRCLRRNGVKLLPARAEGRMVVVMAVVIVVVGLRKETQEGRQQRVKRMSNIKKVEKSILLR